MDIQVTITKDDGTQITKNFNHVPHGLDFLASFMPQDKQQVAPGEAIQEKPTTEPSAPVNVQAAATGEAAAGTEPKA
jgi:hypothetical protein